MTAAALLLLGHVAIVLWLGTKPPWGPVSSDFIQFSLGTLLIWSIAQASRRSEGLARSFWRLTAAAYSLWLVAQALSVYNDAAGNAAVAWVNNLLFCFWFVPLAMAMFLDPEHEAGRLDALIALDFVQAVLVCVAAYLYFFYLPKAEMPAELAHSVWTPYFAGYAFVAGSFVVRGVVTRSRDARALFGRMGIFLALSGCVDALYFYGPGRGLGTGAWFDILWSVLLVVPMMIASTWKQAESPELSLEPPKREKRIYTEIFFLLYPLLVLFMSLRIARERLGLAATVVFLSFVCSSTRLLVTQHRLMRVKDALRREASRDGLTSLWNRKAIFEILHRELLRAERDQAPVGLIMIDVDHFKKINDSRGHAAGDAVLRIIASGIAAVVRPYDSVGRYGGEEFLIVAPGCGLPEAVELAERVRSHVAGCSIVVGGSTVTVSLSLGVATGQNAADSEKLLHAADAALYQAKNAGRNRVEPSVGRAGAGKSSAPAPNSDFWI
ncbi:MAG TPA: GGDEF domain-containing protein [Candidatus Sulfotelmatobacter sp.]|jgi:diguanylate cyclase (GGDEF)-like protein|nr:GGDEF domain-containing protein [Candidatus Sulfotelmatobacter sp.]